MTRSLTLLAVALALPASCLTPAHALDCPPGEGAWTLASGDVACRPCPTPEDYAAAPWVPLSLGCAVLRAGVLWTRESHREREGRIVELEGLVDQLDVALVDSEAELDAARRQLADVLRSGADEDDDTAEVLEAVAATPVAGPSPWWDRGTGALVGAGAVAGAWLYVDGHELGAAGAWAAAGAALLAWVAL